MDGPLGADPVVGGGNGYSEEGEGGVTNPNLPLIRRSPSGKPRFVGQVLESLQKQVTSGFATSSGGDSVSTVLG